MPRVPFEQLPEDARLWIFAAERPLDEPERQRLLAEVDRFADQWGAHTVPLTAGRDLRYDQFLFVAVDQRTAGPVGLLGRCARAADEGVTAGAGGRIGRPRAGAVPAGRGDRVRAAGGVCRSGDVGRGQPRHNGLQQYLDEPRRRAGRPVGSPGLCLVARPGVLLAVCQNSHQPLRFSASTLSLTRHAHAWMRGITLSQPPRTNSVVSRRSIPGRNTSRYPSGPLTSNRKVYLRLW